MKSKSEVISGLDASRVMPIFSHEDVDVVKQVLKVCYENGLKSFEFTNRVNNAQDIFKQTVAERSLFPELTIGAGTVMTADDARNFIEAGADFIVSPILNDAVGAVCKQKNVTWIPGCATPTEIVRARDLGADFIKIFPASTYGPSFVSSVLSIAPGLKLMVTGGIEPDQESISAWSKAGAVCIGFGSNLLRKDLIAARKWDVISQTIRDVVSLARSAKK